MATRKPKDSKRDAHLPGEAELDRVYRAAGHDQPPPALDAAILAEAQRAVARPVAKPFHRRWAAPLSTAAVVVLAVGVVLLMTQEGALNHRAGYEAPNEYAPAPAAPPAADTSTRERRDVAEPATARRAAPEPAAPSAQTAPPAESAERAPATPASARIMKQAETPPATAAPLAQERAMEVETTAVAREEKARDRSTAAGVAAMSAPAADVIGVQASGAPGAYQFNVTIKSPDTGCAQYADWWEVVSEDGKLLYRRVLLHSHVDEQPFARSGGPVPVRSETVVWVRAHMKPGGYGGVAMRGSVGAGFVPSPLPADFAAAVAAQPPLPEGCDF